MAIDLWRLVADRLGFPGGLRLTEKIGHQLIPLVHQLACRGPPAVRDPTAYSQNSGKAIVESQYATTVSGSTPGLTLPQLTASAGVAPDRPPQTT